MATAHKLEATRLVHELNNAELKFVVQDIPGGAKEHMLFRMQPKDTPAHSEKAVDSGEEKASVFFLRVADKQYKIAKDRLPAGSEVLRELESLEVQMDGSPIAKSLVEMVARRVMEHRGDVRDPRFIKLMTIQKDAGEVQNIHKDFFLRGGWVVAWSAQHMSDAKQVHGGTLVYVPTDTEKEALRSVTEEDFNRVAELFRNRINDIGPHSKAWLNEHLKEEFVQGGCDRTATSTFCDLLIPEPLRDVLERAAEKVGGGLDLSQFLKDNVKEVVKLAAGEKEVVAFDFGYHCGPSLSNCGTRRIYFFFTSNLFPYDQTEQHTVGQVVAYKYGLLSIQVAILLVQYYIYFNVTVPASATGRLYKKIRCTSGASEFCVTEIEQAETKRDRRPQKVILSENAVSTVDFYETIVLGVDTVLSLFFNPPQSRKRKSDDVSSPHFAAGASTWVVNRAVQLHMEHMAAINSFVESETTSATTEDDVVKLLCILRETVKADVKVFLMDSKLDLDDKNEEKNFENVCKSIMGTVASMLQMTVGLEVGELGEKIIRQIGGSVVVKGVTVTSDREELYALCVTYMRLEKLLHRVQTVVNRYGPQQIMKLDVEHPQRKRN